MRKTVGKLGCPAIIGAELKVVLWKWEGREHGNTAWEGDDKFKKTPYNFFVLL